MKNLKLNNVNSSVLNNYEMRSIRGGQMATANCGCACKYENSGGSTTSGNGNANNSKGFCSPGMEDERKKALLEALDRKWMYDHRKLAF